MEKLIGRGIAREAQITPSPESGKRDNHNTEAVLWRLLLSQGLVGLWEHIVFIVEGREICHRSSLSSPSAVGPARTGPGPGSQAAECGCGCRATQSLAPRQAPHRRTV